MKINIVLLLILTSLTFFFSLNKSFSCPAGYTSITQVVTVGDCDYSVDLCVKCPTGPVPGFITFTGFRLTNPNCNNSLNIQQVFHGIINQISVFPFIQQLCAQLQAPPCPSATSITFRYPICLFKEKIRYFDNDYIVFYTCDNSAFCEDTWKYCWMGNEFIKEHVSGPYLYGLINCELEFWDVPNPVKYNEPTECFKLHTICNP